MAKDIDWSTYNPRVDNATGEFRYLGKECWKHPELKGLRYKRNCGCVGCQMDANKKYKKANADYLALNRSVSRESKSEKMRKKREHDRLIKLTAQMMTIKAGNHICTWQVFYEQAKAEIEGSSSTQTDSSPV